LQQIGKPQEVYDDPANLFVAKFLGTPPINVFSGSVKGEKLYIGEECVMDVPGVADQAVSVGIRPEGFIPDENGKLTCDISNVEVMGRDVSVVSTNAASLNPTVRSIIDADFKVSSSMEKIRYTLKPHKVFLFNADDETRIRFEVK
jgi:multiple sugar transport system ATP-binding protein